MLTSIWQYWISKGKKRNTWNCCYCSFLFHMTIRTNILLISRKLIDGICLFKIKIIQLPPHVARDLIYVPYIVTDLINITIFFETQYLSIRQYAIFYNVLLQFLHQKYNFCVLKVQFFDFKSVIFANIFIFFAIFVCEFLNLFKSG